MQKPDLYILEMMTDACDLEIKNCSKSTVGVVELTLTNYVMYAHIHV